MNKQAGGVAADASIMDGADAALGHTRTPSRRDDDTTLPRMTGDAGLLMSTTTSELENSAAT